MSANILALEHRRTLDSEAMPTPNYSVIEDFDLSQMAGQGDMKAFEEIYNRYHRNVYAICLKMTKNSHDAEDICHDVFVILFRKIGTFRGEAAFTTWLHRSTVNTVLMKFRKDKTKKETSMEGSEFYERCHHSEAQNLTNSIIAKMDLEKAIDELADGYKNVIMMHDYEGYEHEEIASLMGYSDGTSKSQLHKARNRTRKSVMRQSNPRIYKALTS